VAACEYGGDDVRVAGGVYTRPRIATIEMVIENRLSREAVMTLRHIHYRAFRDLMDHHLLNPQLHFGNRGWAIKNDKTVAYFGDWEDLMHTSDFDNCLEIPLERQCYENVQVTALEKARIYALTKAISVDISTAIIEPSKVHNWKTLMQNDIILAIASGFYREHQVSKVQSRLHEDIKNWESVLGISYEKMVERYSSSLKGLALGIANIKAGGVNAYYQLHTFLNLELATFLALVLVKSVGNEKPRKPRKRH
jgi:hypothetical protein